MMPRLFRRMWKSAPAARAAYRPGFDALEDRALLSGTGLLPTPPTLPAAPTLPEAAPFSPVEVVTHAPDVPVSVAANAPPSTIDLNALFAKTGGVDPTLAPGLSFRIAGNTNPALVTARLADGDLILKFAPGQCGKASVTVAATDAAGATVTVTFDVTVGAATVTPVMRPAPAPSR